MSTILSKLRLLEAKRDSGALTQTEFEHQKSGLLNEVPDAFVEHETAPTQPRSPLWDTLLLWLIAALLCTFATWAITGNLGMASTLGITVLAAFTIKLFAALE